MWGRRLLVLGSALAGLCPALCAAEPTSEACAKLKEAVPANSIGLPSGGAAIEQAELMPPAPLAQAVLPFGPLPPFVAVTPATPEYCKVVGAIAPVDPKAPPIRFQVNLPTQWNGSSVQYGGGGFNGMLITGLLLPPLARADQASPLALGFVTYGTDSGHQNAPGVPLQAFALNDEALTNFSYAAYKKVRDVAVALMQRRYGRAPAKLYFVGFSEGGREGLTMAQRYPSDFDGILSGVPVINWVGLQAAGTRAGAAQFGGGWLDPDKVKLVGDAVTAACDQLDGLADGIVSNYEGCKKAFDEAKLACKPGRRDRVPVGGAACGRQADAQPDGPRLCGRQRRALLSRLGFWRRSRSRHRSGRRLGELADRHRRADLAAGTSEQPRLALWQRRRAIFLRARSELRCHQIRSRETGRPDEGDLGADGFHQSGSFGVLRPRRQAHHV